MEIKVNFHAVFIISSHSIWLVISNLTDVGRLLSREKVRFQKNEVHYAIYHVSSSARNMFTKTVKQN